MSERTEAPEYECTVHPFERCMAAYCVTYVSTEGRCFNGRKPFVPASKLKITMWLDNKIDKEYTMTFEEVAAKFFECSFYKDWLKTYWRPFRFMVGIFVGGAEECGGLHSVTGDKPEEMAVFENLVDYLWYEHLKRKKE